MPHEPLGVPASTCRRCGFPGPHADALDCIDALRSRLADLENLAPAADRARQLASGGHPRPLATSRHYGAKRRSEDEEGDDTRYTALLADRVVGIRRTAADDPERARHVNEILARRAFTLGT
jgi:hypothetical protein